MTHLEPGDLVNGKRMVVTARRLRHCAIGAGVLCAVAAHAQAQKAPTALKPDGAEFPFGFSSIEGTRQLRNGSLVVVDQVDKSILLVDWQRDEPQKVGRNGSGPNEYVSPRALFPWAADSLLVHDIGGSHYLILAPNGTPARVLDGPKTQSFVYHPLRDVDQRGRLYIELRGTRAPGVETQPIVRWTPPTGALDTAAHVARPVAKPAAGATTRPGQVSARPAPFRARDEWTVAPNGDVVIAHANPYFVERIDENGKRTAGPTQPYRPRAVTEDDKAAWRAQQVNQGRARTIRKPGENDPRTGAATTMEVRIEDPEWAETMPPFLAGAVAVSPSGEVWVKRTGTPLDKTAVIDVFDARGVLARSVTLPADCRVVGFSPKSVFVARTDDLGLQYLRKYLY